MPTRVVPSFRRIDAADLCKALEGRDPPLVLDVRRSGAFTERPQKVPGAIPLALDIEPLRIPDASRDRPVVAYCCCTGATSSSRVARWLIQEGYRDVSVLTGGLAAWVDAGYGLAPLDVERDVSGVVWKDFALGSAGAAAGVAIDPDTAFLPRIAGQSFLDGRELPTKREMVTMFVDMVDSTELIVHRSAEHVLGIIQTFLEVVIDVGVYHCGDVHDFEGDGAFLYFEGPGEAVPAAFRLRAELLRRRRKNRDLPLPRISLDMGPLVIGIVGTRFRQTVALVGLPVHRAARILKLAPPGGIITTEVIIEHARRSDPDLARQFSRIEEEFVLDRRHPDPVPIWVAPPPR